ncbi:MAG TPA: hypothetical protein VJR92_08505 [Gemmatimonadaceae bacterium]|nr:hypothetical protein [Gemmatimonadaceae bacterium]
MTPRFARLTVLCIGIAATAGCPDNALLPPPGDELALGSWGGLNAGAIVQDSAAHIHIGCTLGDIPGRVPLDENNEFDVSGSYLLRAYPVAVGPTMPAQFTGSVRGGRLTFVVTVTDTIANETRVLGPVTVLYGRPAELGPCPICRR